MNFEILQRAIPIKTNLQKAIVNCLTQEELLDIWSSVFNDSVVEKLVQLARPYYKEDPTDETLYVLALSIGTIIKEYEWGTYYISANGMQELQNRIRNNYTVSCAHSIYEDLLRGNNNPNREVIKFNSTDHIRYVNGTDVSGHNYGCNRQVEIQKNIDGGKGYTITIYNLDGIHPFWGNNIQMAPKQMEIINVSKSVVSLRGFGYDQMGNPFSDYGIDLYFTNKEVEKIILKMFDRNVEIEYLK